MVIKADLYNEYVRKINYKVIGNQINFLLDNFYFHPLYKGFFEKYYFKYFELVEYKVKQIIVKENEPVQYCYFIKSGSVKLKSNRSIVENHILIEKQPMGAKQRSWVQSKRFVMCRLKPTNQDPLNRSF